MTSHTVEGDISEVVLGTEFSFTVRKDSSDESASINLRINDDDEGEKAEEGEERKRQEEKGSTRKQCRSRSGQGEDRRVG